MERERRVLVGSRSVFVTRASQCSTKGCLVRGLESTGTSSPDDKVDRPESHRLLLSG